MYMKKLFIFICAFLLACPLSAHTFQILIGKSKSAEFTFLENYAIIINDEHYYGPLSKDTSLKVDMFTENAIRLQIKYKENDKYKYKDLGYTSKQVKIVRGFENRVNFSKPIKPQDLKSKKISNKKFSLIKESQKTTPFFRYKNPSLSGWIEFTGPLTLMARKQSKTHFYVIESIPLEDYLVHVTNCEMRVARNIEAYKAQSILARTFVFSKVLERLNTNNKNFENWWNFQFLPDERDQAYICEMRVKNNTLPSQAVKDAVKKTQDKILLDKNNKVIPIHYCAYCGDCSYCKLNNKCRTENGMGSCQNGIAYYTNKKGYSYEKVLKKYHPNTKIADYREAETNNYYMRFMQLVYPEEQQNKKELENNLLEAEDRLK